MRLRSKLLLSTFCTLLAVPVLVVFLLVFSPHTLVLAIANNVLKDFSARITQLDGVSLSSTSFQVESAELLSQGFESEITALDISYSIKQLLAGEVHTLSIENLQLSYTDKQTENTTPALAASPESAFASLSLQETLDLLEQLPVQEVSIHSGTITTQTDSYDGALHFTRTPGNLSITAASQNTSNISIDLGIRVEEDKSLSGTATLLRPGNAVNEIAGIEFSLQKEAKQLRLDAQLMTHTTEVLSLPQVRQLLSKPYEELLNSIAATTEKLELDITLQTDSLLETDARYEFAVSIAGSSNTLALSQTETELQYLGQLTLPLSVIGNIGAQYGDIQFQSQDVAFSVSGKNDTVELDMSSKFTDLEGHCRIAGLAVYLGGIESTGNPTACDIASTLTIDKASASMAELARVSSIEVLDNTRVDTSNTTQNLFMAYGAEGFHLELPAIQLVANTIESLDIGISTRLLVENLSVDLNETLRLQADWSTAQLQLDISNLVFTRPRLTGSLDYAENNLEASADFILKEQPIVQVTIEHRLEDQSGFAQYTLPTVAFDNINPLTAYVPVLPVAAELSAGSIQGSGRVSWQLGESANSDRSPVTGFNTIVIEGLSGYVNEMLFVGLSSRLDTEITQNSHFRSRDTLDAQLATIDIGLPLDNSAWRYNFDYNFSTKDSLFSLTGFSGELLGGEASIADFKIASQGDLAQMWDQADGKLDLVLSNLNLESIVGLADYPGVYVDGLISGYLPLSIDAGVITIDDGLVGALQPGGTIRYTPSSSIPSSNSSVQLVNDALSNYQYKIMNTTVTYLPNGDLLLGVELKGENPDLNGGQAINLNVNISDNIPSLLESLQASRVITEALEASVNAND